MFRKYAKEITKIWGGKNREKLIWGHSLSDFHEYIKDLPETRRAVNPYDESHFANLKE